MVGNSAGRISSYLDICNCMFMCECITRKYIATWLCGEAVVFGPDGFGFEFQASTVLYFSMDY